MLKNISNTGLQIVVVNYESAWRIENELLEFDADLVIADEAHKIKDARTAQAKALHHFGNKARYKLLLTGTPVPNKEMDVFSQYRFLNKSVFGESFYAFRNRYFDMVGYGNHIPKFRTHMLGDFLEKMHSIAFRVTKDECLDLPDITEEIRMVELESKAMKLYKNLEKESYAVLANSEVSAVNVLTKLLRLSQLTGGYLTDDDGNITSVSTAKLNALSDIIDSAMEENKKLVIMARFVKELDAIQRCLSEKHIVWIPPNHVHQYEMTDATLICAVFSNDFIPLFFQLTQGKNMIVSAIDVSDISGLLDNLHKIDRSNLILINGYLYLICAKVIENSHFETATHTDGILYQKVISYLSSTFTDNITLKRVAKELGYNAKYLSSSLHNLTGIHFSKLLAMYRIEHAKKLLLNEKTSSTSQIAFSCGFASLTTFNRAFKSLTGKTPTEYKKHLL